MADIDQGEIHLEDLKSDKPFYSGELQEDEFKIGECTYDVNDIVSNVEKEEIKDIVNRLQKASGTDASKTCITEHITELFGVSGLITGMLRDGIAKHNNGFSYNLGGLAKENDVLYISKKNKNENNPTSDRNNWTRGIINNDILAQRFNLWNVEMQNNIIRLSSTEDFNNYLFEENQLKNGLVLSFVATSDGVGYLSEGYRFIIDDYETKLFEELDETKEVVDSSIKSGDLIEVFYNKNANNRNGAFFLKQKSFSGSSASGSDLKIGDLIWKDPEANTITENLLPANGENIFLNDYPKFYNYIENLLIKKPSQFSLTLQDWENKRNNSIFRQINKYFYESQRLFCYKNNYNAEKVYLFYELENINDFRDVALYNNVRELLSVEKCNKYGIWGNYNRLTIPDNVEVIQTSNGFKFRNFASNEYISSNDVIDDVHNDWEVVLSFICYESSNEEFLYKINNGSIGVYIKEGLLNVGLSSNSSYTEDVEKLSSPIVERQQYWVKIEYLSSQNIYNLYLSTDGENYNLVDSKGSSSEIYYEQNMTSNFGYTTSNELILDEKTRIGYAMIFNHFTRNSNEDINKTMLLYAYNSDIGIMYTSSDINFIEPRAVNLYNTYGFKIDNLFLNKFNIIYNYERFVMNYRFIANKHFSSNSISLSHNDDPDLDFDTTFEAHRQVSEESAIYSTSNFNLYIGLKLTTMHTDEKRYFSVASSENGGNGFSLYISNMILDENTGLATARFSIRQRDNTINMNVTFNPNKMFYYHYQYTTNHPIAWIKEEGESEWRKIFDYTDSGFWDVIYTDRHFYFLKYADNIPVGNEIILDEEYRVIINNVVYDNLEFYERDRTQDLFIMNNTKQLKLKSIVDVIGNVPNVTDDVYQEKATSGNNVTREAIKGQYYIKIDN